MDLDDDICKRYEARLASIAILDRAFYLNESPTREDYAAYAARKQELEAIRTRLYLELDAIRRGHVDGRPV